MNHIEEYLKNNANWCLSGIGTTTITNAITTSIMDWLQRKYHQNKRAELIEFLKETNSNDIDSYLVYYALELYYYMFGQAQHNVANKGVQAFANGIWSWICKGQFVEGCAEVIYEEYKKANKKINLLILALINDLVNNKVITQAEALELDQKFLFPTHVQYENLCFLDGRFKGKSIISVLTNYSAKEIQHVYEEKFMYCESWKCPCNSDIYKFFMKYLNEGKLPIGEDSFYNVPDDNHLNKVENTNKDHSSYESPSDFNVYTDLPWTP